MHKQKILTLPLLFGLFAFGCTKDAVLIDETTETLVPPSGGTAKSAAGDVTLTIAAGTFPEATTVIIQTDRATTGPGNKIGPIYDLSTRPERSSFGQPIAIELQNPGSLTTVVLADFDGATPQPVAGATYDAATKIARAELHHFSRYGLLNLAPSPDCPTATPSSGDSCDLERLRCEYGEQCCCEGCDAEVECQCTDSVWVCHHAAACIVAPQDCERTCEDIEADYHALVSGENTSCENANDCQVLGGYCGVGLGACWEVVNTNVTSAQLEALAGEYTALGCTTGVCDCAPKPLEVWCGANSVCTAE